MHIYLVILVNIATLIHWFSKIVVEHESNLVEDF